MATYDAGDIEATLRLNRDEFDAEADAAIVRGEELEHTWVARLALEHAEFTAEAVAAELALDHLGRTVTAHAQLDPAQAVAELAALNAQINAYEARRPVEQIDADISRALANIVLAQRAGDQFAAKKYDTQLGAVADHLYGQLAAAETLLFAYQAREWDTRLGATTDRVRESITAAEELGRRFQGEEYDAALGARIERLEAQIATARQRLVEYGMLKSDAELGADKAPLDARMAEAEAVLAAFRAERAEATADLQIEPARVRVAELQGWIDRLNAERVTVPVRADTAPAVAGLRTVDAEIVRTEADFRRLQAAGHEAETGFADIGRGADDAGRALRSSSTEVEVWASRMGAFSTAARDAGGAASEAGFSVDSLGQAVARGGPGMRELERATVDTHAALVPFNQVARDSAEVERVISGVTSVASGAMGDLGAAMGVAENAGSGLMSGLSSLTPALTAGSDSVGSMASSMMNLAQQSITYIAIGGAVEFAIGAVGAALAGIPALAGAAAAGLAVVKLGEQGIKDAYDHALKPALTELGKQVSDVFRTGLTPVFHQLATTLIPQVTAQMRNLAGAFVDTAAQITTVVTRADNITRIQQIIDNTANSVRSQLNPALAGIVQSFINIGAQRPVMDAMVGIIADAINNTRNWLDQMDRTRQIVPAVQALRADLNAVETALGQALTGATQFFTEASPGFQNLSTAVGGLIQQIGQSGLGKAFGDAMQAAGDLIKAIPPSVWDSIKTAVENVARTLETLAHDPSFPQFVQAVANGVSQTITFFAGLIAAAETVVDFFKTSWGAIKLVWDLTFGDKSQIGADVANVTANFDSMKTAAGNVSADFNTNLPSAAAAVKTVPDAATAAVPPIQAAGQAMATGIVDPQKGVPGQVAGIYNQLPGAVTPPLTSLPPLGQAAGTGAATGITGPIGQVPGQVNPLIASVNFQPIIDSANRMSDQLGPAISRGFTTASTNMSTTIQTMQTNMQNGMTTISTAVTSGMTTIQTTISSGFQVASQNAATAIQGMSTNVSTSFANMAATVSSQMTALQGSVTQSIQQAGRDFTTQIQAMRDSVTQQFSGMQTTVTSTMTTISTSVQTAVSTSSQQMDALVAKVVATQNSFNTLSTTVSTDMTQMQTAVTTGMANVSAAMNNGFNLITNTVRNDFTTITTTITTAMQTVTTTVTTDTQTMQTSWQTSMDQIKNTVVAGYNDVQTTVQTALATIMAQTQAFAAQYGTIFQTTMQQMVTVWQTGWTQMVNVTVQGAQQVLAACQRTATQIPNVFIQIGPAMYNAGYNMMIQLANGIIAGGNQAIAAARQVAQAIQNQFPRSPAKEGPLSGSGSPEISGRTIVEMLASGLTSGIGLISAAVHNMTALISQAFAARHAASVPAVSDAGAPAGPMAGAGPAIDPEALGASYAGGLLGGAAGSGEAAAAPAGANPSAAMLASMAASLHGILNTLQTGPGGGGAGGGELYAPPVGAPGYSGAIGGGNVASAPRSTVSTVNSSSLTTNNYTAGMSSSQISQIVSEVSTRQPTIGHITAVLPAGANVNDVVNQLSFEFRHARRGLYAR